MYKHKNKTRLEKSKRPLLWAKRKIILFITAFMIGMANGINTEEKSVNSNKAQTEQQDKKE